MRSDPEEPDLVASLVLTGTRILDIGWREILAPYKIKIAVTGIYCHQSPMVEFSGMRKNYCEFGDLLWCHIHTDRKGDIVRNAILYQAKKSSQQPYTISTDEENQLKLYTKWPEFSYVRPKELAGQVRYVKPAAPRRGAQYLLIDSRPPEDPASGIKGMSGTYPIGSCIAQRNIISHSELSLELVHTLELLSGDPFDELNVAQQDIGWSRIIWDLLLVSANKVFRRINSGYSLKPRLKGASPVTIDGCLYMTPGKTSEMMIALLGEQKARDLYRSYMESPPIEQYGEWFDEEDGGISVIIVETSEELEE